MSVSDLVPASGLTFTAASYRAPWQLLVPEKAVNVAITPIPMFVSKTDIETRVDSYNQGQVDGLLPIGAAGAVNLMFLGTGNDNSLYGYQVRGIDPIVEIQDGKPVVVAYQQKVLSFGVVTLSAALTAGAVADDIEGVDSTDLLADSISVAVGIRPSGFAVLGAEETTIGILPDAGTGAAFLHVNCNGSQYVDVVIGQETGTLATTGLVMAQLSRGNSRPGKSGAA